jgi:hypothetical protein
LNSLHDSFVKQISTQVNREGLVFTFPLTTSGLCSTLYFATNMAKTTYNQESLDRHNISRAEADEVLATGIWDEMSGSERGNDRLMFVGFTASGRLLEIGVEYFDDEDREHVFHGNDATACYRKLYETKVFKQ